MINKKLVTGLLIILPLTLSMNGFAKSTSSKKKPDTTVIFDKYNKPSCNTGLQLYYSPPKDQYFCSRPKKANYVHVGSNGLPYCHKPHSLKFTKRNSRYFKGRPTCE